MSAALSGLSIGSLSLTPAFAPEVTAYTANTTNASDTVQATPEDTAAGITIRCGSTPVQNGGQVAWQEGANTLTVLVGNGDQSETYTVAVTYQPPEPPAPPDTRLSALTLGSLSLNPAFDPDTLAYTADTTNARNTVTATPADSDAAVTIMVDGESAANGSQVSWSEGANVLAIQVAVGDESTTYTVAVTKS